MAVVVPHAPSGPVLKLPRIVKGVHGEEGRLNERHDILSHEAFPRFLGSLLGLTENSVPLHPMANDHYPY